MAPVAQPGVGDDLGTALAQELAHRGALGGSASPELACRVLQADTAVAGAGAEGARFSRAHLSIEVVLAAAPARRVVLEATRSYAVDVGDPLGAAAEREAAFAGLAAELARDAVAWALMAPVREEEG